MGLYELKPLSKLLATLPQGYTAVQPPWEGDGEAIIKVVRIVEIKMKDGSSWNALYIIYWQMSWVVQKSPLWHKDSVQVGIHRLPSIKQCKKLEDSFVNDAIKTNVYCYPRKLPIIPTYSATKDKCARSYFNSPLVNQLMNSTEEVKIIFKYVQT